MNRKVFLLVFCITFLAVGSLFLMRYGLFSEFEALAQSTLDVTTSTVSSFSQHRKNNKSPEVYTVLAVGDMMLDRGVEAKVDAYGNGDFNFIFKNIADVLRDADVAFGNLEGSLSDVGADGGKAYSFRFEPRTATSLASAGFDVVSLANNHIFDWGRESLCATLGNLREHGIASVGAGCNVNQAERPYVHTFPDGTSIGFLAFTEFYAQGYATETRAGLAKFTEENMVQRIQQLKNSADVVAVSLHWGHEYHTRSNESQQKLARILIDAGADIIIGHHPHVVQEIERYRDGWIIYSLGNFIFDQKFSEQTMKGLLARIYMVNGKIMTVQPIVITMNDNYQPEIAPGQVYDYIAGEELEAMHEEYHRRGAPRD